MRQRLVAAPYRVAPRPFGDPGIKERLAAAKALREPLGTSEVEYHVIHRDPGDPKLRGKEIGVEDQSAGKQRNTEPLAADFGAWTSGLG